MLFLDSGFVKIIDQIIRKKLQARGTDVTLNIAGSHGTKDLKTKKVHLTKKVQHSRLHSLEVFVHQSISMRYTNYDCNNKVSAT